MIIGPTLGGAWLGNYFGEGAAAGASGDGAGAAPAASASGAGGPVSTSRGRYKGSRQHFADGAWHDADTAVEEVGSPPSREAPFEPPKPWTPEPEPAPAPEPRTVPTGVAGLGLPAPKARPRVASPERRSLPRTGPTPTDDEALTALLALMGYTWR